MVGVWNLSVIVSFFVFVAIKFFFIVKLLMTKNERR